MKIFVDSANLADIQDALDRGFPRGITTNPSILAKEERRDYRDHIRDIIALLTKADRILPLSVEVFATEADEMIRQAEQFVDEFGDYDGLTVKVPVGWDELRVISTLAQRGVSVNATCAMALNQAVMALGAGARYISLFWGRIRDTGYDASTVVSQVRELMDSSGSSGEIIVGSIRQMIDVNEALRAGAHIVTVPPQFFPKMCSHPKTDEAVHQFVTEFAAWMQ
ncbi:MAG TPA: transaldolase family protein [Acidimicrobiia bacterium]|jgi:transaldolase|nr:transaldolase family protein [Acidimicrobiia bacterium]